MDPVHPTVHKGATICHTNFHTCPPTINRPLMLRYPVDHPYVQNNPSILPPTTTDHGQMTHHHHIVTYYLHLAHTARHHDDPAVRVMQHHFYGQAFLYWDFA